MKHAQRIAINVIDRSVAHYYKPIPSNRATHRTSITFCLDSINRSGD